MLTVLEVVRGLAAAQIPLRLTAEHQPGSVGQRSQLTGIRSSPKSEHRGVLLKLELNLCGHSSSLSVGRETSWTTTAGWWWWWWWILFLPHISDSQTPAS